MEIKRIDKWRNKIYGSDNFLFEFENGVKLTVVAHPATVEFVMHVIIKGGSYVEDRVNVPHGTAHFVEHLMCNPNEVLKSFDEMDNYRFGNSKNPRIYTNAYTSVQNMTFYGITHQAGALRMIDDLIWQMNYPRQRIEEFIEKERKIIIAEEARELKENRDKSFHFRNFLLGRKYPEFRRRIIGTVQDLEKIKTEHINKYLDNVFTPKNVMITIQTNKLPDRKLFKKIELLAEAFNKNKKAKDVDLSYKTDTLENKFDLAHFQDTDYQHIHLEMFMLTADIEGLFYTPEMMKEIVLKDLLSSALGYRLYKRLREVKNLVYSADTYSAYPVKEWIENGIVLECPLDNFDEALAELHNILTIDLEEFLSSKEGKKWLISYVSGVIYKLNVVYNRDYARNIGLDVLRENTPYKGNPALYNKTVKAIKIEEIIEYYKTKFKDEKMRFWAYSPYDGSIITKKIKDSPLVKKSLRKKVTQFVESVGAVLKNPGKRINIKTNSK